MDLKAPRFWLCSLQEYMVSLMDPSLIVPCLPLSLVVVPWSWHLKYAGVFPEIGCKFPNCLSWIFLRDSDPASECQASALTPWPLQIPGPPLELKLHVHQGLSCPFMVPSHSFSLWPSGPTGLMPHKLETYMGDANTLSSSVAITRDSFGYVWAPASIHWSWESTSQKIQLNNAGLFLI